MEDKFTANDLAIRWRVTISTVNRWRAAGRIPPPIPSPSKRGAVWDEGVIEQWEREGGFDEAVADSNAGIDADLRAHGISDEAIAEYRRRGILPKVGLIGDSKVEGDVPAIVHAEPQPLTKGELAEIDRLAHELLEFVETLKAKRAK